MACPVCPAAGWLGGWLGGYFGIHPPQHSGGRMFSAVITANLISITVIALKVFFDISLCAGGEFTLGNMLRVGIKTLILGIIYSIGVNYILDRYIFPSHSENEQNFDSPAEHHPVDKTPPCCCQLKQVKNEV